jgi:hypothetical protein
MAGLVPGAGPGFSVDNRAGVQPLPTSISGPGTPVNDVLKTIGVEISAASIELKNSVDGLKSYLTSDFITGTNANTEALERMSAELAKAAVSREQGIKAELNIDNTQKINITGGAEIVQQVLNALNERGFVTQQDLGELQKIISEILRREVENGIARPGILLR